MKILKSYMTFNLRERSVLKNLMRAIVIIALMGLTNANAQIKIYVMTDLEGVSGVYKFKQTREKDTPLNIQACEYFMGDLAAVIKGLRDAGATEIIVVDGHGSQCIIPHLMAPGAKYVTGKPKTINAGWKLDESFTGLVMFGFHAMMGTPDGVLCHTQSSLTENRYWYNGVESGELVQSAASAGRVGVPPIMVSGDEATCREAIKFFGDAIVTVPTKRGISREAAVLYPFDQTRQALYEGAKKSIDNMHRCKPYVLKLPVSCKMQFLQSVPKSKPKLVTREWISKDGSKLLGP